MPDIEIKNITFWSFSIPFSHSSYDCGSSSYMKSKYTWCQKYKNIKVSNKKFNLYILYQSFVYYKTPSLSEFKIVRSNCNLNILCQRHWDVPKTSSIWFYQLNIESNFSITWFSSLGPHLSVPLIGPWMILPSTLIATLLLLFVLIITAFLACHLRCAFSIQGRWFWHTLEFLVLNSLQSEITHNDLNAFAGNL